MEKQRSMSRSDSSWTASSSICNVTYNDRAAMF